MVLNLKSSTIFIQIMICSDTSYLCVNLTWVHQILLLLLLDTGFLLGNIGHVTVADVVDVRWQRLQSASITT